MRGHDLESDAEVFGYGVKRLIPQGTIDAVIQKGHRTKQEQEKLRRAYQGAYWILPKWTEGLKELRPGLNPKSALDYWRKGKEIIVEELPDFHLRPEWKPYRERTYKSGAKTGVIQHAIFKDILSAL